MARFRDRATAGAELGARLGERGVHGALVAAMPGGGVVVGKAVARALGGPLDVVDVHDVTAHRDDLGVGAVTSDDPSGVHESAAAALGVGRAELAADVEAEQRRLRDVVQRIRRERGARRVTGASVVVVDDGLTATAAAMAAADNLRAAGATRVILAVPVAVQQFVAAAMSAYDDVVTLEEATGALRLADWYDRLPPVSDDEVVDTVVGHTVGSAPADTPRTQA